VDPFSCCFMLVLALRTDEISFTQLPLLVSGVVPEFLSFPGRFSYTLSPDVTSTSSHNLAQISPLRPFDSATTYILLRLGPIEP